ncbi:MAG TPA: helix-turn-helix transcriptional regulator [Dermatophilaceae bacterium]
MNSGSQSQLGAALQSARARAGLTVRQLAEAADMTPATVSRIETGQIKSPRPEHLVRLARALDVDLEDLYALAGYYMPQGLPELRPYLRSKYGLSDRAVEQLDEYFQALRSGWDRSKEVRHEPGDQAP